MKKLVVIFILILITFMLWGRRNIMMTGYWSPTSEMIYQFSNDPELNPDGWIGENWENGGYDVYAFFPAFNRETRDFEVDYQATWEDFWATVEEYNPIAIISYGAGAGPWEIEYNARNLSSWVNDYEYPYQPTPSPPDSTVAVNYVRHSTLPVTDIEAAVEEATPLNAWIDWNGNPGAFLCEYMAYLGMWYQDIHSSPDDEYPCLAAGFTHLSSGVNLGYATTAAQAALRVVIDYLNQYINLEGMVYAEGVSAGGTEIRLISENDIEYTAIADEDGSFGIPLMPSGEYAVSAFLDRYYYYQGEALIDSAHTELEIELEEFPLLEPLSWCAAASQEISAGENINLMIASVFEPEDLAPYINCHLRELIITSAFADSSGDMEIVLYQGTPDSGSPMLILLEQNLSGFEDGEECYYWIDEDVLQEAVWEQGLTLACQINSEAGEIAWMDEGPAIGGKGNMIKVSGQWMEAEEMLGVDGNWDLRLGFYGTPVTEETDDMISSGTRLINYPNPFNPATWISFYDPASEKAELAIYNIKGQLVMQKELIKDNSGYFRYYWEGENSSGSSVASGIYLAKLKTLTSEKQRKMLMIK